MTFSPTGDPRRSDRLARRQSRQGAATVEFAVVAPLVFLLILSIIEFGRAFMVLELFNNAARNGCRLGVLEGTSTDDITAVVNDTLTRAGVSGGTTTVLVNGAANDASTATTGDVITVTVSIPAGQISWLPGGGFLSAMTLTSSVVMRRE
jgi:Flp pilus assembly protein TadG